MNTILWNRAHLNENIHKLSSVLCVGLDTDIRKIPDCLGHTTEGMLEFNKQIILATSPYAIAFKINSAFYESLGAEGWNVMKETISFARAQNRFVILDAKRGDIGNTADMYAKSSFEYLCADAVTVAPYMGKDSVTPFLKYDQKWTILLALTSNPGSEDFQLQELATGKLVYEDVLSKASSWASNDQMMYVVGATRVDHLEKIRTIVPNYFLLIPGVGAQGGDLNAVMKTCLTNQGDLLINASRSIIYASSDEFFAISAAREAEALRDQMALFI